MKVLNVLPSIGSESGGPVRSTLASCRAVNLVDPGVGFTLATTAEGLHENWRRRFESQMPPGMTLQVFPALGRNAFKFSPGLARWLWKNVAAFDLVVVRALFNPISTTAARIARSKRVPYLVVPHGTLSDYTLEHRRTLLKRVYLRLLERRTVRDAAAVWLTTLSEREQVSKWVRGCSMHVIPHPFEPDPDGAAKGPRDPDRILFLSRVDPVKGLDKLLDALVRVRANVPRAHLVIAGSGTPGYEARIRSRVERLGLEQAVRFTGFVGGEAKARLLAESAVFVLPSRKENFGVAVVEAMDAGLPVVVSREVGLWEEIEAAGAGLVTHESTAEALARSLERLLGDEGERLRMGRNGRKLVHSAFAPERVGGRILELYEQAAAPARQRGGA